jgi:hypothetical protein
MGHDGMHYSLVSREIIADSVETVMNAERFDGVVLLAGCDKSEPGMLMAAARLDLAAVFLYAGSILPGRLDGRDVTIVDAFEAVGACLAGRMTEAELGRVERAICPGEGACGGMFTANTMASAAEALGMSLPGSAAPPAPDSRRDAYAERSGEAVVRLVDTGVTARQIMTREAFENAIAVVMALGGSTNAVLHLLAIAHEAKVDLDLDDFNRIGDRVPHIADMKPFGRYVMTDVDAVGGVPVVMRALLDAGLLHGDALTVTGRTMAENLDELAPDSPDGRVIRPLPDPLHHTGGLTILRGSLAPDGAVVKSAGLEAETFEGSARVFDREQAAMDALPRAPSSPGTLLSFAMRDPRVARACVRCSQSPARSRAPASARTCCWSPTAASPAAPPARASATWLPRRPTAAPSRLCRTATGSGSIWWRAAWTCWSPTRNWSSAARTGRRPTRRSTSACSASTPGWWDRPPEARSATERRSRPLRRPSHLFEPARAAGVGCARAEARTYRSARRMRPPAPTTR